MPAQKLFDVKAPEKTCNDVNCPFHGNLTVRGSVFEARVESFRMNKTATVVREVAKWVPKYERYERETSKIHAHVPPCLDVKEGDVVLVGECRPIAKTVSFVVVGVRSRG